MKHSTAHRQNEAEAPGSQPDNALTTLYYDGLCPLCQREMKLLRRLKSDALRLLDIHKQWQLPAEERESMLRQLHLLMPDGRWLIGADASVEAWRYTRIGWLIKPLRWPLIGSVVDRVYRRWALSRFRRLYGSGRYLCTLPEDAQNDS